MFAVNAAVGTIGVIFYPDDVVDFGGRDFLEDDVGESDNAMFLRWRNIKEVALFHLEFLHHPTVVLEPNLGLSPDDVVRLAFLIVVLKTGARPGVDIYPLIAVTIVELKPDLSPPWLVHYLKGLTLVHNAV